MRNNISINNIIHGLIVSGFILLPQQCVAHLRWFVSSEQTSSFLEQWEMIFYVIILGVIGFAILSGFIAYQSHKLPSRLKQHVFFQPWPQLLQWRLLSCFTGITLLFCTVHYEYIAPNINISEQQSVPFMIQAFVSIMLIFPIIPAVSGALILGVVTFSTFTLPLNIWVDYLFEFLGIGFGLLFCSQPKIALFWLRVGFGMQLAILAIHNKFLNPDLGLMFLSVFDWNFPEKLGLEIFSDMAFVFSAGSAELIFGVLIALGISTRFVCACVAFFFILTSCMLGINELMGHIPVIACAMVLVSLNGGLAQMDQLFVNYKRPNRVLSNATTSPIF